MEATDSFYADVKAELLMPRLVCKAPVAADKVNHGGPVRRPKELQLQASRVTLANYRRLGTICVADLDPSKLIGSYQGCGSEFIFC